MKRFERNSILGAFAIYLIIGCAIAFAVQPILLVSTRGAVVYTVGCNLYSNSNCTNQVASIDWGYVRPNTNYTYQTMWLKSMSDVPTTIEFYTANWTDNLNSTEAYDMIDVRWTIPNPEIFNAYQVKPLEFILVVGAVQNITTFRFDIVITAVKV